MANPEKHKTNPMLEWLADEEDTPVPAKAHGGMGKTGQKAVLRRPRQPLRNGEAPKVEPALMREPSQPPKIEEKPSPAHSREHLLKEQRRPTLRAPHSTKPGRAAGAGH